MITKVQIKRFKAIEDISLDLEKINVIVGANNAGKSSVLQALQFATSVAQTAKSYYPDHTFSKKGKGSVTVSPEQLIYSPLKNPYALAHKESLKEKIENCIYISFFQDDQHYIKVSLTKGRNKNLVAKFEGDNLGKDIASLKDPFCMYVPGLAGIPFSEESRPVGAIRRIAAKGDSNTIFRNILKLLKGNAQKWDAFIADLRCIFPEIDVSIITHDEIDGSIDVNFKLSSGDIFEPIDLAGTGILQAIQIAAYVNYFSPKLLLLDEPDSHLHPNNQQALASLLVHLVETKDFSILISTHSRHLMAALKNDAKFFLMKNGKVSNSEYSHYSGLLELGALDDYDKIRNGEVKYIILTEDGSLAGIKYLKQIFIASGFLETDFIIYPFHGINNILSAKISAQFLTDLNSHVKVIIYRDRDGLYNSEISSLKVKYEDGTDGRIKLFVSKYNDVEAYYCTQEHIKAICENKRLEISLPEVEIFTNEVLAAMRDESQGNFMAHRSEIANLLRLNPGETLRDAPAIYSADEFTYAYGKKMRGLLASKLQQRFVSNVNLLESSSYIADQSLRDILANTTAVAVPTGDTP